MSTRIAHSQTFTNVADIEDHAFNHFVQYQLASRHGVAITASAIIREPTDLEGLSLASTLCPVESRCGAESDHDTEEGEEDEGEESEGDSDFMNDVLEYGGRDEDGNVL